jgi:hypothetical protein
MDHEEGPRRAAGSMFLFWSMTVLLGEVDMVLVLVQEQL